MGFLDLESNLCEWINLNNSNYNVYFKSLSYTHVIFKLEMNAQQNNTLKITWSQIMDNTDPSLEHFRQNATLSVKWLRICNWLDVKLLMNKAKALSHSNFIVLKNQQCLNTMNC